MLDAVKHLVDAGFAVHWLRERSKAPFTDAWSSEPVYSFDQLKRSYHAGYNVGVRPGEPSRIGDHFLQIIDLDVRVPAQAHAAKAKLREIVPGYADLPTVASGSGGDSRHFYFLSPTPFRSKKLAHSAGKHTSPDGREHWDWEIELFGTGKQAAMPPSIHPDTGKPYRWEREFDFDMVEMGLGPTLDPSIFAPFFGNAPMTAGAAVDEDDDEDLGAYLHKQPMDLSREDIDRTLADLPLEDWCDDRDGWLNVGMALHHQFQGSDEGLKLWNDFSSKSKKFDAKDQKRVWKSFQITAKSIRFAVLLRAAADARLKDDLADGFDEEEDDDEDLIGDLPVDDDEDLIGDLPAPSKKPDLEWTSKLDRNDEGAIKPTLHNIKLIVRNDSRMFGLMNFNQFTSEVVQRGMPGKKIPRKASPKGTIQLDGPIWELRDPINGDMWTEGKDNAIRAMIEAPTRQGGYGIKVSDRDLRAAIDIVAQDSAFHPVREYLHGLKWDGKRRLDTMFIRFLGADDTPYTRMVARMTLTAGVARVMKPGHKFDFAVILEGLQGRRKSTFIRILAKSWFSELDGDFHDPKMMVESMQGSWVLEIPELSGFGRADVRQIKAFISRQSDKVRLAYARRAQLYPRQCIMLGSTNDREYLRDDTGGRRFWPIECNVDEIDTVAFAKEVDQLWAEAVASYNGLREQHGDVEDLPLYLSDEGARDEAFRIQEDRRVESAEDGLAGKIGAWLDSPMATGDGFEDEDEDDDVLGPVNPQGQRRDETCLIQLWVECFGRDPASYGQLQSQQLGRAMKKIKNWASTGARPVMEKYGQQRIYRRITD